MRRGLGIALCLTGCGIFGGTEGTTPEAEGPRLAVTEVHGARVVSLRRPTPGHVHVALFVDAGARDAEPAQVALVAAWIAAGRSANDVHARVLPDGTSFEVSCETARLAACVAVLGRALGTRSVNDEEVTRARGRLVAARRRAAGDDAREAEALALEALLGERAAGFDAFGRAESDDAVTVERVSAFLAEHYGPARSMLVAAGDVRSEALVDAAETALAASPEASAARATRRLVLAAAGDAAQVAVGTSNVAAAAVATADLRRAAAIARAIVGSDTGARLETSEPVVHAFEVRGGALVLAHVAYEDLERAATELAVAAQTAIAEERRARPIALDDDAVAAAHRVGLRWIASSDDGAIEALIDEGTIDSASDTSSAAGERAGAAGGDGSGVVAGSASSDGEVLALGALIAGGRADASDEEDPDRAARERATQIAERALAAAREAERPAARGEVSRSAASVVTSNGARIDVRRRTEDARAAVAIRFAGGAASDPPAVHGRAAMLAVLVAEACPALGPGGAAERATAIDATIAPRVDGRSWGLVVEAPAARWREALDLATRCALAVTPSRTDVERARILLLDRLDGGAVLAAWAARSLAADAPGGVAPLGGLDAVRETSVASVRRAWREATTGARIAIAIVGDVPVDDAVARAARRVSRLPSGAAVGRAPDVELEAIEGPLAEDLPGGSPRVVVTWRGVGTSPGAEAGASAAATRGVGAGASATRAAIAGGSGRAVDADGARVFADAVAARLGAMPGLRLVWSDGGTDARGAWAAIGLDASEAALADLPSRVAAAVAEVDDASLRSAHAARARARVRSEARPAAAADAIARDRLARERRGDPDATWAALRAARPGYVIGRPRASD